MTTCPQCKWAYPNALIQPVLLNDHRELACGICALALVNRHHGSAFKAFQGPMAEALRQRAIRYRADHPERTPTHV